MPDVILSEEVAKEFGKLKEKADKGNTEAVYLLGLIDKGISQLARDAETGKQVSKRKWPKEYIQKYQISNLWKLNLDKYWRMIYTLRGRRAQIIGFVIDILDHKRYDKKFGYKSK